MLISTHMGATCYLESNKPSDLLGVDVILSEVPSNEHCVKSWPRLGSCSFQQDAQYVTHRQRLASALPFA